MVEAPITLSVLMAGPVGPAPLTFAFVHALVGVAKSFRHFALHMLRSKALHNKDSAYKALHNKEYISYKKALLFSALYAECPCDLVRCMQSVLII